MAITLSSGERQRKVGTWQYAKTYTQSTSTTPQALDVTADCHILGMGTATGSSARNLYTLGTLIEGQETTIYCLATGEASVVFTQPSGRYPFDVGLVLGGISTATDVEDGLVSATGQIVFQSENDYIHGRWMNAAFHILEARGVTLGTTT